MAFAFLNTRVLGLSIPFHRNFEEVNGPAFAEALQAPAVPALVAEGSRITVRRPTRLFG